jgi:hypothetical protein
VTSRNQRLDDALRRRELTRSDLAASVECDDKTVERWVVHGTVPKSASVRHRAAETLGVPAAILWPDAPGSPPSGAGELVGVYPTRRDLPTGTIASLISSSKRRIDVLAYAAMWLWDGVPGCVRLLESAIGRGVSVRMCMGDPAGEAIAQRGREEGIGDGMPARCRLALSYAAPISSRSSGVVRVHATTLYASIFRFDHDVFVNWHLYGIGAPESPVFHFRRAGAHGLAAKALDSFDRVWETAQPVIG